MSSDLPSDLQATLGAGFRVTRELPGGGMSRVFVAEETLLQREIVIKLLPPDLMAGLSMERFRTEMQHAAKLQHPHIVPVLAAGVIDYSGGTRGPYYTMPFIRGDTLRTRLQRSGALPPEEVRRILCDVVDALGHAHDHGIVHRDIKPDNIFLAGKSALVTDFGVSKALMREDGGSVGPITGVGVTLGTPGYMSPEQAAGETDLDVRSDLYAVGVLGYELLAGERPFAAESIRKLLVAQAVETPRPLQELVPSCPPGLAAIVMRCLEKRPQDRFDSAHTLLATLDQLPTGSWTPLPAPTSRTRRSRWLALTAVSVGLTALVVWWLSRPARANPVPGTAEASVAVLPPEYFLPDSAVAGTLADLVDHISNNLSRVDGLKVVNYMSVGTFLRRGSTPTLKEIGEALGVEYFVLFVPRRSGRGAEVAVQLINAPTQAQLWVASYSPDSTNLDEIDGDVVARVTHSLLGKGADLPESHAARARREGAHADHLAGQRALRRRTPEGIAEAIRYFESAVRLDSTHAEAVGRLATALALQLSYGYRTTLPSYTTAARALVLAERAIALDPTQGDPIAFLAYLEYLAFAPIEKVRADFERAIARRPFEADVAGWHALMLLRQGETERSLQEAKRALELDPLSSARHLTLALAALGARRYELAVDESRRTRETEPTLRRPRQVEALALLLQQRGAECASMDLWPYLGVKALCLSAAGRAREAGALLDSLRRAAKSEVDDGPVYSDVVLAQELAIHAAMTGDAEATLTYVRLAFARSPVGIDQRIVQSGVFDRVRKAAGFEAELARLQNATWPRVLEQRQRLEATENGVPLALRGSPLRRMF